MANDSYPLINRERQKKRLARCVYGRLIDTGERRIEQFYEARKRQQKKLRRLFENKTTENLISSSFACLVVLDSSARPD
jgi:hypothetical protein